MAVDEMTIGEILGHLSEVHYKGKVRVVVVVMVRLGKEVVQGCYYYVLR